MIHHLKAIIGFQEKEEVKVESKSGGKKESEEKKKKRNEKKLKGETREVLKTRVQDLELSTRTLNVLETVGIRTLGGLVKKKNRI